MPTLSEFLNSIDFGHETAERDASLAQVFVQTQDFRTLRTGKSDLVTGVKGSGKSALYLMLLANGADRPVHLVPAQNQRGPLVFADDLPSDRLELVSDEYFKRRWTANALALAVNRLLAEHPEDKRLVPLRTTAHSHGLLLDGADEAAAWERAGKLRLWGSAFTAVPGPPRAESPVVETRHLRPVMAALADALERTRAEVWVLYDRLDDILVYDPARERAMLRGLLQAVVSLASLSPQFKIKAFLRHDLLDRVTQEQPVRNIDQLSRQRIRWNARAMMRLGANRILATPNAGHALGLEVSSPPTDDDVDRIWIKVVQVPQTWKRFGSAPERVFHHLFAQTVDSSGEYNPRVVITYLSRLADEQAALSENDTRALPLPDTERLITHAAMVKAVSNLSHWRMQSYLYAEFQHLRIYIDRLRDQANRFANRDALLQALKLDNSPDATEILRELCACGLLAHKPSTDEYFVSKLYKAALVSKNYVYQSTPAQPRAEASRQAPSPEDLRRLGERFAKHRTL